MQKWLHVTFVSVLVAGCLFLTVLNLASNKARESMASENKVLRQTIADLQRRITKAESARSTADQKVGELEREVSSLAIEKQADRQVIQDLWTMLVASTRRRSRRTPEKEDARPADKDNQGPMPQDPRSDVEFGAEAVKKLVASSGGNLDAVVQQIMTSDGRDETLQRHADQPAYWIAAASLAPDRETALEYLKEAAHLHPESAMVLSALVEAQVSADAPDESTLAYINELERLDPTNSLGDCYAAYCRFQNGDFSGAVQSLSEASAKGRFTDDRIDTLMARYDYFLNEGCSDPVALGLSAFTLPLGHLGLLRQTGQQAIEQVHSLVAIGQYDDALQVARDISNIGRTVSSSGRFLVYDRVGIALQESGLAEQRQIFEALGDVRQVQEIDLQLQAIQQRSSTIDTMVQAFGGIMVNMSEADLADYVDGTILNGELATLQSLPQVAEALAQAQTSASGTASEAKGPEE